jgi:hypothetical protein
VNKTARFVVVVALLTTCLAFVAVPSAHAAANSWPHRVIAGFSTPNGTGYWLAYADGTVTGNGNARMHGEARSLALVKPIVGGASTPSGKGYWLVASDGGVFTFGDAHLYGSLGGTHLRAPIFSIYPTNTGKGYWLFARDGGVFTFGDAHFFGSASGMFPGDPIVGVVTSSGDNGYELITRAGAHIDFGKVNVSWRSVDGELLPLLSVAPTPNHSGFWAVQKNGPVAAIGSAVFLRSPRHIPRGTRYIFPNPKHTGYILITPSGALIRVRQAPGR